MSWLSLVVIATGSLSVGHSLWHSGFMNGISLAWRALPDKNCEEDRCLSSSRGALWRAASVACVAVALAAFIEVYRP